MKDIFNVSYWKQFSVKDYSELNRYLDFIKSIQSLGNRNLEYCEHHHIVPKSFDISLSSSKYNIIKLSAKEHYFVHELLTRCFTGIYNQKMIYAFKRLIDNQLFDYKLSDSQYENIKVLFSGMLSNKYRGSNNPFYGKHHSKATKDIISKKRKLYFKNMTEQEHIDYCLARRRENLSSEARRNISNGQLGNINRLGKKTSDETKRKISEALTGKLSGSNNPNYGKSLNNKFWMTDGINNIRVSELDIDKYLELGYRRGRISRK